ncbi:MAG TPA: YebC/PmpR family DNA-binding transcriptional regulator, partial [Pirellulales bacterium]|nr:YebC/PmpR family DNA-binding transcriptional regulator [Pirellulales bacterium]
ESGCVNWMFERKGLFVVPSGQVDEEALMELALEAGADDVKRTAEGFEVTCDPAAYQQVADRLTAKGLKPEVSQIARIPTNTVDLDAEAGRNVLKLMEKLDDHEDVQSVAANYNIPDDAMAEIAGG